MRSPLQLHPKMLISSGLLKRLFALPIISEYGLVRVQYFSPCKHQRIRALSGGRVILPVSEREVTLRAMRSKISIVTTSVYINDLLGSTFFFRSNRDALIFT